MNRSILRFLPLSLNASLLAAAALVACGGGNDSNGQLGDSVRADERSTPVAATRLNGTPASPPAPGTPASSAATGCYVLSAPNATVR